jgi:SAM-dependent methyltransferase
MKSLWKFTPPGEISFQVVEDPSWEGLTKGRERLIEMGADVIIFIQDDCMVSKNWLYHIRFAFEWNGDVVAVAPESIYASELALAKVIGSPQYFYTDFQNDGTLMREHLSAEGLRPALRDVKPLEMFGGPCIAIKSSAGFDNMWSHGACIKIPGPPIYCAGFRPPLPTTAWPTEGVVLLPCYFKLPTSQFIAAPINLTYRSLEEVNLGPIHHDEPWQQDRMKRLGEGCIGSVLDIGCADGALLDFCTPERYVGVDLDRVRIDEAKKRRPKHRFYVVDATYGLPFPDMSFETVVCAECMEHVPYGRAIELLKEMTRVSHRRILITLPVSERMHPNVDHVWFPNEENIDILLTARGDDWNYSVSYNEDFAFIQLDHAE